MRIPLVNMLRRSPLENTLRHARKVAECAPIFVEAVESYFKGDRDRFELNKEDIRDIEAEADRIKRNIRSHLPPSILLPFSLPAFFSFLREADKVVDCVKNSLYWMSYMQLVLPADIEREYVALVRSVGEYLGLLPELVERAHTYFETRMESDRQLVKEGVREIRHREKASDDMEKMIIVRLCAADTVPPKTFFIMTRLVETTGDIADHLENAADMMRVLIAR